MFEAFQLKSPTSETEGLLALIRDPRLAPHALAAKPVWLWRADATAILWANPAGAAIFGAPNAAVLRKRNFDGGQPSAAQIERLAPTLLHGGPPRLERLRGFGAGVGKALTCNCTRIVLADSTSAVLVVAADRAGPSLRIAERASRLLDGIDAAAALFSADGRLLHATAAAATRLGSAHALSAFGAGALATEALANGRATGQTGIGLAGIDALGEGDEAALLLTFPCAIGDSRPAVTMPTIPAPPLEIVTAEPPASESEPVATPETEIPVEAVADDKADAEALPAVADAPAVAAEADAQAEPATDEPAAEEPAAEEPAADEPAVDEPAADELTANETAPSAAAAPPAETSSPALLRPADGKAGPRRHPLRFVWQMDADGRFTLDSDEFADLTGPGIMAALGRPWADIAADLQLDPDDAVAAAIATRNTWSGVVVAWPVDGSDERLPVELSGLPSFDRDRTFLGYRGFGVCRDVERLAALAGMRRSTAATLSVAPGNILRFPVPASAEMRPPVLSPIEHNAFREIGRQLSDRLFDAPPQDDVDPQDLVEIPAPANDAEAATPAEPASVAREPRREPAVAGERPLIDRLPVGVLVYRFDHLLYANRAFLEWTGYADLADLSAAGGLDSLFIEPAAGDSDQSGRIVTISSSDGKEVAVEGRLFSVPWQGETALALVLVPRSAPDRDHATEEALSAVQAEVQEWRSIVGSVADGVIVADHDGHILSANAGAARLFGDDAASMTGKPLAELLAGADRQIASDAIERLARGETTRRIAAGVEVTGRVQPAGDIALLMTLAPVAGDAGKISAVFRDISRWKKSEQDLIEAKREAERASAAKSAFLAKISHEIRTPLNAIIGFSEVMMAERFGAIGNERYKDYLKDIHASGEHVVSLLNDLLDLSKIEAGKMDLTFTSVGLNDLTQQCVALMQPQANRERIIIRTSLAARLPQIVADARSVKQIVLNLLSNSIKFTGAGGQVIVSSAINDNGQVVLRVRDTGVGMSDEDIAVALEPFRQLATSARWGSGGTGLGLPLTKALAEANHANFSIKSAVNAGTLVEVAFPSTKIPAE